jgi:hypothetical protein
VTETTPSIWDDADGFVEAWNSSPDTVRLRHQKSTRRRGGLREVCGKAVEARHGVTFSEFEAQARAASPQQETVRAAHDALRAVAGLDPDHAREANGKGFDRGDVALGHALASGSAESIASSPAYAALVVALAGKYRRQVAPRLALALGHTQQPISSTDPAASVAARDSGRTTTTRSLGKRSSGPS